MVFGNDVLNAFTVQVPARVPVGETGGDEEAHPQHSLPGSRPPPPLVPLSMYLLHLCQHSSYSYFPWYGYFFEHTVLPSSTIQLFTQCCGSESARIRCFGRIQIRIQVRVRDSFFLLIFKRKLRYVDTEVKLAEIKNFFLYVNEGPDSCTDL